MPSRLTSPFRWPKRGPGAGVVNVDTNKFSSLPISQKISEKFVAGFYAPVGLAFLGVMQVEVIAARRIVRL